MSVLSTHLAITSPDHPIDAHMNGRIPIIAFQHVAATTRFEIHLNSLLSADEQEAWLMRLAQAAEELAEQVALLAAEGSAA